MESVNYNTLEIAMIAHGYVLHDREIREWALSVLVWCSGSSEHGTSARSVGWVAKEKRFWMELEPGEHSLKICSYQLRQL